jgi:hypothetical protein
MSIVLGLVGIALVVFVVLDVLWTTLRLTGGGWMTIGLTSLLWRLTLRLTRSHERLAFAGFAIIQLTVALWIGLNWVGWTLVLQMDPRAVVVGGGRAASFWERAYFAAATLITMSPDSYRPGTQGWRLTSTLAAANGFILVSLIITYLLPIVMAELERRRLAVYITALGRTPQEILLRAWNGKDFGRLPDHLVAMTLPLMEVGQGHLAYPVLHVVHSRTRETALAPSIAVLDEAITLLAGVVPDQRPDKVALYPLRQAIAEFLTTLAEGHLEPESRAPVGPRLDELREAGIATVSDEEFRRTVGSLDDRRRLLLGLVEQEGWRWEDVERSTTDLKERFQA